MKTEKKNSCCKFILAIALAWAFSVFIMGLLCAWTGYGSAMVFVFSSVYIGYAPTVLGSVIGAIWAFVDIIVFSAIVYFFYRIVAGEKYCPKSDSNCADSNQSLKDKAFANNEEKSSNE